MEWMQLDGSKIDIKKMTNLHIKNTVKSLQRKIDHITSDEKAFNINLSEYKSKITDWLLVFKIELKNRLDS